MVFWKFRFGLSGFLSWFPVYGLGLGIHGFWVDLGFRALSFYGLGFRVLENAELLPPPDLWPNLY